MKSNPKTRIIILITLGIIFVLSPIITSNLTFTEGNKDKISGYSEDNNLDNENLKISKESGPIYIDDSDPSSNWSVAKDMGICTGNGTYSEPYVIEDLVIDGGGSGSCILIENSDVPFKIENCTVYNSGGGGDAGILLLYVYNSQLIDNNCSFNHIGILLGGSDNNIVSGNTANNNILFGIWLGDVFNTTISGNTANNNVYGIHVDHCNNNTISGNTANNNEDGICLNYCHNNTISGNTANNNDNGIFLRGVFYFGENYNNISGNTVSNNYRGIFLIYGNNNTVSGNTANNNNYGIHLWKSDYNSISGNIVNNNSNYGIYLENSDNNSITFNTITNNDIGIYFYHSYSNEISNNTFYGNNFDIKEYIEPKYPFEVVITVIVIVIAMAIAGMLIIRRRRPIKKAEIKYLVITIIVIIIVMAIAGMLIIR